jgi:hypothetical protein
MPNPFTSGSAPGRAQPADRRRGTFKPGHEKRGGRKLGTQNLLSIDFKRSLFEAAYRIGLDGNGKDGIVGYFSWVAEYHPRAYCSLLPNVLVLENAERDTPEEPRSTIEEISQAVRDYIGLPGVNRATGQPVTPEEPRSIIEAINQVVRDYIGLTGENRATGQPVQVESDASCARTGQPFPVGTHMQLAVENPKAFCTLFAAAFLRLPTNRRGRMMPR